ncbi:MAG TPA: S-layer homology domain-containing protein, partial [Allocoleopsis sp.]
MRHFLSTFSLITLLQLFPSSVYAQTLTVDPVKNVIAAKIMNNYPDGKFHSDKPITRAELAAIIVKTFRLDENVSNQEIDIVAIPNDVPPSHWGYKHIHTVLKHGIMKGY